MKKTWNKVAAKWYADLLCKLRTKGENKEGIPKDVLESWEQYWNTPEYKKKYVNKLQKIVELKKVDQAPAFRHIQGDLDQQLNIVLLW